MTPISSRSFTFRALVIYILVAVCIAVFVAYVLFQARFIIAGPVIVLTNENGVAQTEKKIVLEGTASNIVRMSLNGRQIYTDTDGNFKEALVLENGYTIATLQAEDRYGRKTNLTRKFVYVNEKKDNSN